MVQNCTRGSLYWILGSLSVPRRWSNTVTGLERWSMPQPCQCLSGTWTKPLTTTCFNLVSPKLVRQLDQRIVVGPFQLKQFHSVPLRSLPFYFLLFLPLCLRFLLEDFSDSLLSTFLRCFDFLAKNLFFSLMRLGSLSSDQCQS